MRVNGYFQSYVWIHEGLSGNFVSSAVKFLYFLIPLWFNQIFTLKLLLLQCIMVNILRQHLMFNSPFPHPFVFASFIPLPPSPTTCCHQQGCGGSKRNNKKQTSYFVTTSSSSCWGTWGIPRPDGICNPIRSVLGLPQGLPPFGHAENTSTGRQSGLSRDTN